MKFSLTLLLALLTLGISAQTIPFSGTTFRVEFPTDFTARGSIASEANDGFLSVFFISPDEEVEFYAYAQRGGSLPDDIALQPHEKEVSREVSHGKRSIVTHWTISAKDNSYLRSYQETRTDTSVKIVGIKYKNHKAYNRYKKQYLAFKASFLLQL